MYILGNVLSIHLQYSHPLLFLNKVPSIIFSFYPCFSYSVNINMRDSDTFDSFPISMDSKD